MLKKLLLFIVAILIARPLYSQENCADDSLSRELQEVVVTAKQPATKLVGSTLVSTIAGTNLAGLGTALDVLAQLPLIKVQDNDVTVIGRSNIEIYIDGRPMREEMELQQLLSSDIRKIELLMSPGAAYESTTGAVLKISTKRKFIQGLSLTNRFQLQKRRKWSVMDYLSLSYRIAGMEFFVNGTVNRNNSLSKGITTNTLVYNGKETIVGSSQYNSYPTTVGVIKAGFNYAKGSQSLGAYYRFAPEKGNFLNSGTEWLDNEPPVNRLIAKHIGASSHLASLYYENVFADKYMLHFDGDFRTSHSNTDVATTYPGALTEDVNSADKRKSTFFAGKLYVNFPLWNGEFTAGTQNSYTRTRLDYNMLSEQVGEYIPSALSIARQTSAALFFSWAWTFGKLSLSAGARYEYVKHDFCVNGKRDDDVSRRCNLLTPDVSLGYSFNDNAQLSLSYKAATVKPPYSQLTSSLSYVGMHEIEGGNPALRDERMHNLQLFGMWKNFMLQADFVRSIDTYAYVKELYPADNLQLHMHPVNIDVSALSIYLVWSKNICRWTPNVTAGMYRQRLETGGNRFDKPIFSYYFDNTFALPHDWSITANMSGSSCGDMHTNRFGATVFTMDASIAKSFIGKALTVKLSATDIFNTANNNWTMNTCGVFVDKRQSYDRRGISLDIIYNFQPRKSKYKGSAAAEEEMKRLF
ncbi:MAG: outer membrane beta-barrel family protein [Muribaculaceae bacterium]|nr:outer membrane beta-barrel family protein [Muribaculaceae bacterium]